MKRGEGEGFSVKKFFFNYIYNKILFSFFLLILIILALSFVSIREIREISEPINNDLPNVMNSIERRSELDSLAQFIRYYDEVLTMSARNYAFTGDVLWKDRYYTTVSLLDGFIERAIEIGGPVEKEFFSSVDVANLALIELEKKAIGLVDSGNKDEAVIVLESKEYWDLKDEYKQGLVSYVEKRGGRYDETLIASSAEVNTLVDNVNESRKNSIVNLFVFLFLGLAIAIMFAVLISRSISLPIGKLKEISKELEKGNFRKRVDIKTGDELEDLGNAFNVSLEALEKLDSERKEIDNAKTRFLSITSHELRSPMAPMRGQLQMLEKGYYGKLTKKQKKSIEIVLRNTERLDRILVDFLDVSRIEAARMRFRFIKVNLAEYVKMVVNEMKQFMPDKHISIELNMDKIPKFEVDPDRVMQVLRNLLNNAIKFCPENCKINVNVERKGKFILFGVKDRGIGIKLNAQGRIFEPFFQGEQTIYRKYGGTGLGLALCKGIVQSQGGMIWFDSKYGKGTTFYFTIPLKPVKDIKPIKLLFSSNEFIAKKLELIFNEMLGPLGSSEFTPLRNNITKDNLFKYINSLVKQGIIPKQKGLEFKKQVISVLGVKKRGK